MWNNLKRRALTLLLSLAMIITYMPLTMMTAYAAAGDVPDHDKILQANPDGTYTIALNVTGDSEKQIQKVNVIVIVDRSGSMASQSGTGSYVPTEGTGTGLYGLIGGEYVPLERRGTAGNRTFWYNGVQYTGQRYQYDATATRMQATQAAVNSLAETLLEYNGKDGNPNDTVQMALVSFATTAQTNVANTTSFSSFQTAVNGLNANGGTNWEAALQQANGINFGDSDQTFVIFFSDGSPTFHSSNGGYNNWNQQYGVYGSGQEQEPNMTRSYTQAVDDATTLASKVGTGNFYTIFAYGTSAGATYMTNLTTSAGAPAANNYSASNTAELNDAFAEILESIEMAGIGAVSMEDGTTSSVTTTTGTISHLLTVDEDSYKYYRAGGTKDDGTEKYDSDANTITNAETGQDVNVGEAWDGAPEAKFEDGAVKWDLSDEGVLENDVTYTVTFDCWPSQETLDIVADIKNDPSSYDSLDANIKKYIDEEGNLKTNTTASLSYTDTRTGESNSEDYDNPDPVQTAAVEQLAVSKKWENELDEQGAEPITLNVTRDGTTHHTVKLSNDNNWTATTFISIGILRHADDGEYTDSAGNKFDVLETGHEFTFTEPEDLGYYWEIEVPTVRPMLLDNVVTMLILKEGIYNNPEGKDEYTIDGKTYYVGDTGEAALTATNERRSVLNLTKAVDGEDADPDQTFPFTLNVNDSKSSEGSVDNLDSDFYVWFSVWDGDFVDADISNVSGAEKEMEDGEWTGYYYAPSGTSITVNLRAGDNLRFINLPTGSTYTFTEGTLPANYVFTSAVLSGGEDESFVGAQTSTGTIQETNTEYTVTYTNTYSRTDIEITKVWDDNGDQDGKRPTAEEFKSYLVLKADGTDVTSANASKLTVTDNGNNKYTAKWTGLDRFAEGSEIAYTVEETEIPGYTTTGSPAEDKGTITNTHTPETTKVKVVKVWDDSNDIGGIRPASISAQLKADGENSGAAVTLNEENDWTYTWENLPKYKAGTEIVYSADETAVPAGYKKTGPEKTTAEDGTVTFTVTNTYNPTPVSVDPPVQKIITGNEDLYNGGDFTFTIENTVAPQGVTAPMPAKTSIKNQASDELEGKKGYYEFGNITFTVPGTYTYKVTESGSVAGVTNDPAAATGKTLTFTVTDDGTGKLVVSPTTDQVQLSFTNAYDADGEASIVVTKEITGAAWPADKTLTLTIAGEEGAPMPEVTTASLTAAGSVTFGPIAYGLSDAGKSYEYTITESSFGAGWSGSPASVKATVAVTDNGDGTLGTTVTYSPENATFTNTYTASGSATLEVEKKIEGAAWPKGKTITMTLAGTESAPMPAAGGETRTLTEAGKATFGTINYTAADAGKTYTYTISEDGFGDGWTGSGDVTATVAVTDNGDGTLATNVTYSPESDTITNTYTATGTAVLNAKKAISGAEWPEGGEITFTLSGEGGTLPETKTVTLTEPGTATFGAITYTAADAGETYEYTITEDGFGDGWTGSPESITATVVVSDNGDGTLDTEITYSPENATITNTYKAEGEAVLEATKALAGAEWPEGKTITFTLSGEGGTLPTTKTVTLTEPGKATFGAITYDESDIGETYEYTITEDGFGAGWTGTPEEITATVVVSDNGDGTLDAEITYSPEDATITNTYTATGSAVLEATKVIGSAEWPEGKTITFTLSGEGGTLPETKTVTLTEAGKATFGAITYDESDAGQTYTYTISEDGFGDGWTGSGDVTATVKVTDNGNGTLATAVTYSPEDKIITNTYAAEGEVTLEATKTLTGRDWKDGESYTFTLYDGNGEVVETKEVTKNGAVSFSTIEYKLNDLMDSEGHYASEATKTYTISETSELPGGVTKSADITATVTLTDNGDGTIGTEVAYTNNDTIINTYAPSPVNAEIEVTKKITGYKPTADEVNGEFKMILTPVDGAPMPEGEETLETIVKTEGGEGSSVFDAIQYTAVGEYKYTVTEEAGDRAGMTYDSNEYTVTVIVTDDLNGKLVAEVKYSESSSDSGEETQTSVEVTNDFQIKPIEVTLNVTKIIKDESDSAEDATFTFVLKDSDKEVVDTKTITTNGFNGSVDFDALKFEKDGTYTYYIQETVSDEDRKDGWTYDEAEYPVVIKISDDLTKAELVKDSVAYDGDETATTLEITNVYKAEPTTVSDITVHKTINDTSGSAYETTFTFTLTGKDGAPMPENNKASVTGEGSVTFAEIKYEKAGTFKYTVTEEAADAKGYIYDTTEYDVTVTVTDEAGHLVAKVTYGEGEGSEELTQIDVINTYDPEDAKVKLTATKLVTDKTGSAPDEVFKFELVDSNGEVVETVERTMGGPVEFSEMTFSKVGTYEYTIREVAGSTPGYTYDTAEYKVTITVTDPDKDGVLKAKVEGNNPEIENPYEVPPGKKSVTDDIPVTKELSGRDLEAGEFTFLLKQVDGDLELTATNDANGAVVFDPITFNKVGEYVFTVREVQGDLEDVTYDTTIFTVVATVTDPHTGDALEVKWTCSDSNAIVFNNDYEPPEEPEEPEEPGEPDTGDHNELGGWLALMLLAGAGGAGLYARRRREDQ